MASSSFDFNTLVEPQLIPYVPKTLTDVNDATIVVHWIQEIISSVFNNDIDRAFIDEDTTHGFIDLFLLEHQLREYYGGTTPDPGGRRFGIYGDNLSHNPNMAKSWHLTLTEAMCALLTADAYHMIQQQLRRKQELTT